MVECMRRAAEECGEGEAEAVQLDCAKPMQLRWAMSNATPEQMTSVLAQLQTMGVDATVTQKPATVQEIRRMCDRICALAEEIAENRQQQQLGATVQTIHEDCDRVCALAEEAAEHSDVEDPLGPFLDQLIAIRNQMQPSPPSLY